MADEPSDDLRISPTASIPGRELVWRFSRSGGAGGQHVNTTDSRVELSWDVESSAALSPAERARALRTLRPILVDGVVTVVASDRRSQLRNRGLARERLADLLRDAIAPPSPPRRPTRPSRAAQQRRIDDKKRRGQTKVLRRRPPE